MRSVAYAVALLLATAGSGTVSADDRYDGRWRSRGYGYGARETFRIGLDRGYEEGLRQGRRDGGRRSGYRFSDDRRYRQGDAGYRRAFGPRYEYIRGFRAGYERGYRDGYESARYSRYGRHDRYYKTRPWRY